LADKRIMSKITVHTHPFHYIVVEDLWNDVEHKDILNEMLNFESKGLFLDPSESQSAKDDDGKDLKKNKAIFIDSIFHNRDFSSILTKNRKLFDVLDDKKMKESWFFDAAVYDEDTTLVSYYENSDYYEPHRDKAVVTVLSYFFKEPQTFKGGDITFTDFNLTFKVRNGLTIIFPSNIKHEVSMINLDKKYQGKQKGRFCMTQFLLCGLNEKI